MKKLRYVYMLHFIKCERVGVFKENTVNFKNESKIKKKLMSLAAQWASFFLNGG
jgi:hypothetical protein